MKTDYSNRVFYLEEGRTLRRGLLMGCSVESVQLASAEVASRWARAGQAMKKENQAQLRKLVGKVSQPRVIAKSGWHKARRIILTENAGAVTERKLVWIK